MLSFLILFPILGSIFIGLVTGKLESSRLRQITTILALIILTATVWLLTQFDLSNPGFQFSEYVPWSDFIGLSYSLGVDGLSLPLIALNSVLTIVAIYSIGETINP